MLIDKVAKFVYNKGQFATFKREEERKEKKTTVHFYLPVSDIIYTVDCVRKEL